jgi:hypothetical protein
MRAAAICLQTLARYQSKFAVNTSRPVSILAPSHHPTLPFSISRAHPAYSLGSAPRLSGAPHATNQAESTRVVALGSNGTWGSRGPGSGHLFISLRFYFIYFSSISNITQSPKTLGILMI